MVKYSYLCGDHGGIGMITEEKDSQRVHLKFLRDVTREPITMDSIMSAVRNVAPLLHIQKIQISTTGIGTGIPRVKNAVYYEDTEETPIDNPVELDFSIEKGIALHTRIYPYGSMFSEADLDAIEMYVMESCLSYQRMNMTNIIEEISLRQYITRLPNANGYLKLIGKVIATRRIREYSGFYFNLKAFGNVNRMFGQDVGDEIIRRYARVLKDFVQTDEFIGHLGGDNFTAMIKKERRQEFVRFLANVKISIDVDGEEKRVFLPATSGVWDIEENITEPGEVISRSAVAYNFAKNVTHNSCEILTPAIMEHVIRQKDVLGMYKQSLEKQEFIVYYQPKVDTSNNEIVGAEALVRWISAGNIIAPSFFIPTLERNGRMLEIDYYVLKAVCADLRTWVEREIDVVPVSVNFSRGDLNDENLAKNIADIIYSYEIDPRLIEIELTETADIAQQRRLIAFIDELNEYGISTAIDDFGTGYSSLGTLRDFRVRTLKIDRSFVTGETFSKKDAVILKDIVHMAGQLEMNVIMEGVERDDQLDFVMEAGCCVVQGFYFDKPLPKKEFVTRLESRVYE